MLEEAALSVRAHRVGVHVGHFVDVRVKVQSPERLGAKEDVEHMFEAFAPLGHLAGKMPSLPDRPILVERSVGGPRPASHCHAFGGMQVVVGNIKTCDPMWHLCFSLVVNNMVRGAYGAALLMAEYYLYMKARPAECALMLASRSALETAPAPSPACPASSSPTELDLSDLEARHNKLTSNTAVSAARAECMNSPGDFHGAIARRVLHWFHPELRSWLSWNEAAGRWAGWDEMARIVELHQEWVPWEMALETRRAPFFEWFVGAHTSAAFNEVDRHVLSGHGAHVVPRLPTVPCTLLTALI